MGHPVGKLIEISIAHILDFVQGHVDIFNHSISQVVKLEGPMHLNRIRIHTKCSISEELLLIFKWLHYKFSTSYYEGLCSFRFENIAMHNG